MHTPAAGLAADFLRTLPQDRRRVGVEHLAEAAAAEQPIRAIDSSANRHLRRGDGVELHRRRRLQPLGARAPACRFGKEVLHCILHVWQERCKLQQQCRPSTSWVWRIAAATAFCRFACFQAALAALWRCWRAGRRRCRKGVSSFSVSAASACAIKIPTGQLKYKVIEPYSVSFELPVLSALIAHVGSSALHILQDVVVVGLTSTSSNAVASASAAAVACYQLRLRHQMCRLQRSHQHRCRCWQGRDCGHRRDLRTSTSTAARASKAYIICSSAAGHI